MQRVILALSACAVVACSAPADDPLPPIENSPVASVEISPSPLPILAPGSIVELFAQAKDSLGNVLPGQTIIWSTDTPSLVTVSSGLVTATAIGSARVTASTGGKSATATLSVVAASTRPVQTVKVDMGPTPNFLVGSTKQLQVALYDDAGVPTTPRPITWSSQNTSIATINATGLVTMVSPGLATILARAEGRNGFAGVAVQTTAPAANPACQNEPPGLTRLTENKFDARPASGTIDAAGWNWIVNANLFTIVSDATAPKSASAVVAGKFPGGMTGGSAPFIMSYNFPNAGGATADRYTTVYQCFFMKHSKNFTDNGNSVNKFAFMRGDGTNHFFGFQGDGQDLFRVSFELQSPGAVLNRIMQGNYYARPLDVWRKYEILLIGNSTGAANGQIRVWVDGLQVIGANDVRFWLDTALPGFRGMTWEPTYGGGTRPVPADQFEYVDNWYISAKP